MLKSSRLCNVFGINCPCKPFNKTKKITNENIMNEL